MALQQFDFKIVYNPGTAQEQVDIFTRDVDFTAADEFVDKHLGMVNTLSPIEDRAARQQERLIGEEVASIPIKTKSKVDTGVIPNLKADSNFPSIEEFVHAAKEITSVPDGCIIQEDLLVHAKSGLMFVPEILRARILYYYHYSRIGAHQGAQKMIVRIKKHFYWPLLAKDCVDFTAGCLTWQRRMNVVNLVGKGVLLSTDFNLLVSVDAIGPFMYKNV
ncbi:hypothetical protein GNI_187240 [Gregarina niphandrodes]|uniref:Integrase zinc-binding domain-containing protein n=1 Tax=Gregarina niphandrodes TaxID=110365 RepID=A0A023AWL9_GRENI|nr:hypothetical protein GNI_187240 [Gregarina niphandrodes]EZG43109.1 hypothetical protein GNI_187240 [Gregarina niphandrodes]|eukprot:XP_011133634.1 hypothetical protein GNI_187240 [Gregarina niphandrodes]